MEYVGEFAKFQVYRQHDGTLEGFRTTKRANDGDRTCLECDRVVTTATTIGDFIKQVTIPKKKPARPPADKPILTGL